ncbi:MAG: alcohol dehydrogenase catalytic domain-containing protein [Actinobacteria bacterium]|nr:alcohol dehydrogenase catalytic domain-containing protein [Actinomycetota bacterium]
MKVLRCYNAKDFRIEEIEKPAIDDNEMLIEMLCCGLCGSDIIKIFDENLKKPDIYGHEVIGKVVETGRNVKKFKLGDIVVAAHHVPCGKCHYCLHGSHSMCKQFKETNIIPGGFSQYIMLSDKHINNTTFKLPDSFDLLKALFVEPLACCIRAMDRIERLENDIFSVVGAGAIGILFIQLIKLEKMKVVVIDMDQNRLELAKKIGADFIINPSYSNLFEEIKKVSSTGIDIAILTVTNRNTINDAISYIRMGGNINIFGMAEKESIIPVDFGKVYKNEITIKSSYSSTPQTLARAYEMIISGKINVTPLMSEVFPLKDFKTGLDLMLSRKIYKAFYKL